LQWQVQEAKQRFSEVLRLAEAGEPQIITRHGGEVAVMISMPEYRRLRGDHLGLMEYLRTDPMATVDLDIEREADLPREIDLAD
jgi:prevent-host-death family protein